MQPACEPIASALPVSVSAARAQQHESLAASVTDRGSSVTDSQPGRIAPAQPASLPAAAPPAIHAGGHTSRRDLLGQSPRAELCERIPSQRAEAPTLAEALTLASPSAGVEGAGKATAAAREGGNSDGRQAEAEGPPLAQPGLQSKVDEAATRGLQEEAEPLGQEGTHSRPTEREEAAFARGNHRSRGRTVGLGSTAARSAHRRKRGLAAYDSDPEISAESEGELAAGQQDLDEEIAPRLKLGERERKKPGRRKRPRLVPPHSRSSRYRGVYWEPKGSKWYSSISSNHKQIHLGSFNTEEEAAQAFDREAIRLRGPSTFTNFPSDSYLAHGGADSDGAEQRSAPRRRPPNAIRRRIARQADTEDDDDPPGDDGIDDDGTEAEMERQARPRLKKDDQAANALLSLGSSLLPRRAGKAASAAPEPSTSRPTPPRSIEPPVTLRAQKRKRGGPAVSAALRPEGLGRLRSKYTGVYQQSRGNGWFASICVDKSMRYLGTFATEEEAARAFDQEAIRLRGTGIELNMPHEAEGFMLQLKEEEEAGGTPRRLGPAPVVSAGPDFEDHLRSSGIHAGLAEGDSEGDLPAAPRAPRARERSAAQRSRQMIGRLARDSSPAPEPETAQATAEPTTGLQDVFVPSWKGRRQRSNQAREKRVDPKQQTEPQAAHGSASLARPPPAGIDTALSNYISLINSADRGVPGLRNLGGTSQGMSKASGGQLSDVVNPQATRPAASYAGGVGLPGLQPAFGAWSHPLAQTSSFAPMPGFLGLQGGSGPAASLGQRQPQPFMPGPAAFGMPNGNAVAAGSGFRPLSHEGIDLNSILGGLQSGFPLSQLLSRSDAAAAVQHPVAVPHAQVAAFTRFPGGVGATVGGSRPAFQPPQLSLPLPSATVLPHFPGAAFSFPAAHFQPAPPTPVAPQSIANGPREHLALPSLEGADPDTGRRGPHPALGTIPTEQQRAPGIDHSRRGGTEPSIGVI